MDGSSVFAKWRQCAPPPNTCYLGPTRILNPDAISIGSDVFAGLTTVTYGQTDRPRSATVNRVYVRSTAMRPNNRRSQKFVVDTVTREYGIICKQC